jgi:peptidoglycan/LPS O-acetylase OafA/YrhL
MGRRVPMSRQAQAYALNQDEARTISDMVVDRLSRVTSSGSFIPEIDGLRFFAVASVVFFHINTYVVGKSPLSFSSTVTHHPLNLIFQQGDIGVSLFFTISGFILSLPFAMQYLQGRLSPSLGRYYMRRVTRLEPPYIINMLLTFIMLIVVKHELARELLPHLLASLLYSHNVIYEQFSFINGVAWSLEVEVQFYLLAPLLCKVFLVRQAFWRRLSFVITMLCGYGLAAVTHALGYTYVTLFDYLQFFMVGFF